MSASGAGDEPISLDQPVFGGGAHTSSALLQGAAPTPSHVATASGSTAASVHGADARSSSSNGDLMNECAMRSKFAEPALQSLWSGPISTSNGDLEHRLARLGSDLWLAGRSLHARRTFALSTPLSSRQLARLQGWRVSQVRLQCALRQPHLQIV